MKKLLILFLVIGNLLIAQQAIHKCYTTEYMEMIEQNQPGTKESVKNLFDAAQAHAQQHYTLKATNAAPDTIYRIPVVFHVVYNGANQNTDHALLESQIDVLNDDFRRMNADTTNTRAVFKDRASDVGIEFFLATIDPDGNPTSGVTRTSTTSTFNFLDMDGMKSSASGGADSWDTDKYLNIWVCDLSTLSPFGIVLGFAYPPSGAPNWPAGQSASDLNDEGVAIHYEIIGKNNPLATGQLSIGDKGRTAVHEVGHYWGLRHIWGDSGDPFTGGPDCDLTQDDGFSDTPHMGNNSQAFGCSFAKNSCMNGESPDEPDMVENYMDYSTESCQNMFTQEQADLMQSMAVIGRPNLVHVIQDENFNLDPGEWIVVNGTDTFQMGTGIVISLQVGDLVMFLNENNGYNYTVTGNSNTFTGSAIVTATKEGTVSFAQGTTGIRVLYNSKVSLFPNPTKDIFTIQHQLGQGEYSVAVYNQLGQQIINTTLNSNYQQFSTQDLRSGIYYVKVTNYSSPISVQKLHVLK
ncbi:MAG: hypothetical protein ACI9O4_000990 [Chitinophagales bacterium]